MDLSRALKSIQMLRKTIIGYSYEIDRLRAELAALKGNPEPVPLEEALTVVEEKPKSEIELPIGQVRLESV